MENKQNQRDTFAAVENEPHLRDYLCVLQRRRWVLIATVFIVVTSALVAVLVMTPVYRPTCTLLLQPTRANILPGQSAYYDPTFGAATGGAVIVRQFLETQYRLIVRRPLVEKTFYDMGYDKEKEFAESPDPTTAFGKLFSVNGVRNTFQVKVSFEWKDAEHATRTLDCLVAHYIQSSRERALGMNQSGLDKLNLKAENLRPRLTAKSDELQQFISVHNLVSLEKSQDIVIERLKELSRNLTIVEDRRIKAKSRYSNILDALSTQRTPEEMPEVVNSPTVRDLKLEYIKAKLLSSDLEDSLGPNHPQIKAAQATLHAVADRLSNEVRSVLASAQAEFVRARQQESEIRAALAEQEKTVMAFNGLAVKYKVLKDAHATLDESYHAVVKRIEEIEIAMAIGSKNDGVFVDEPPQVPIRPAKPRKKMIMVLAGFMGMMLGICLCFLVEHLDTTIKTKEDVERLTGATVLGYVPAVENGQVMDGQVYDGPLELLALERPLSGVAEMFRSIRTALSFTRVGNKCHQFVVTSALPSEGKTMVSVNVAMALARSDKQVVLIDADLRRARVHKIFGVEHSPGLSNLLAGDDRQTIKEVLRRPCKEKNLSVITSGPIPPNPAELLNSARMGEVLAELGKSFDYVIFDTPPIITVTDALVLTQRVDGALLVVRSFVTEKSALSRTRELFGNADARLIGVVLNGVDASRGGYQYEQYHYYNYYGAAGKEGKRRKERSDKQPEQAS